MKKTELAAIKDELVTRMISANIAKQAGDDRNRELLDAEIDAMKLILSYTGVDVIVLMDKLMYRCIEVSRGNMRVGEDII